jgi:NADPH:quinone reductase-like Zn-dependent oxidoreductase
MTTQIASAVGIHVIGVAGASNFDLVKRSGAAEVFDYKHSDVVDKVVGAVRKSGGEFVGIFDAIAVPETFAIDVAILEKLGGGHLALTHPPVGEVPSNVKAGMIFAVNDAAAPVWKQFVTPALESGKLKCLPPPTVLGKGLEYIQEGLKKSKAGVSGTKLVVEL